MTTPQINFMGTPQVHSEIKGDKKAQSVKYTNEILDDSFKRESGPIHKAKINLGQFGIQELSENFSVEQLNELNSKRTLPEGYYLRFNPKVVHYINGCYNGTTPASFSLTKLTDEQKKLLDSQEVKYTDKLPKDYELVNKNGKSYVAEKGIDLDRSIKITKASSTLAKGVLVFCLAALGALALSSTKFGSELIEKLPKMFKK